MNLINLYYKMPIFIQNILMSIYGYVLKKKRYNKRFLSIVKSVSNFRTLSNKEIQEYQDQQFKKMVNHVFLNIPFYREYMLEKNLLPNDFNSIKDIVKFPVIDKSIVKNNIKKFVWAGAKNVYLHPTGGTTGSPLFMRTTRDEEMYNFALYEDREKNEFGIKTGMKNAVFLGKRIVSESQKKPPYWRHSYPLNQVMYSVYHMDNNTLKSYIEHLRNWNPDYITGYVSAIYMLSKYLLDQKIEPLQIKATFLSSETLHDFQKEIIEKALQTSICNGYSMAEYTAFISNCKENNLHIHEDYGYVELHNTGYEGIKEVVATTLFNYTMPLIRYRTYDYVEVGTNFTCSCGNNGRTAIKKIIGRDDSFIKTREGRLISSAALSLIFKKYPEIEQTQIIQEDFDNLVVHIICNKISDDSLNSFRDDIRFNCGNNFNIKIETVNEILKTSNGKSRLIISRMD